MTNTMTREALVRKSSLLTFGLSNPTQRNQWKNLGVGSSFFDDCYKHPANYILKEKYERVLYCFECTSIDFQDEKGKTIWSTDGSGKMDPLPVDIQVFILNGKMRIKDKNEG